MNAIQSLNTIWNDTINTFTNFFYPSEDNLELETSGNIVVKIPRHPAQKEAFVSVVIAQAEMKEMKDWTKEDFQTCYKLLSKIRKVWNQEGISDSFLYGTNRKNGFEWEFIPYPKAANCISRATAQLFVLWKLTFGGGKALSDREMQTQKLKYLDSLSANEQTICLEKKFGAQDVFCDKNIVNRQKVYEGKTIFVLYSLTPLAYRHFIIITKEHRNSLADLNSEEFLETQECVQKIAKYYLAQGAEKFYCYSSDGEDSGQTQAHFHEHLVIPGYWENLFGSLKVLRNIVLYNPKLNSPELTKRVEQFAKELEFLSKDQ